MTLNPFLDPAHAGAYFLTPGQTESALTAANHAQRPVIQVGIEAGDKEGVLRELGASLGFPEWYGANLDALYDCLTEPDVLPAAVVRISGLNPFCRHESDRGASLMDVLVSAADFRRESGHPLWLLLDAAAPGVREWPAR